MKVTITLDNGSNR